MKNAKVCKPDLGPKYSVLKYIFEILILVEIMVMYSYSYSCQCTKIL